MKQPRLNIPSVHDKRVRICFSRRGVQHGLTYVTKIRAVWWFAFIATGDTDDGRRPFLFFCFVFSSARDAHGDGVGCTYILVCNLSHSVVRLDQSRIEKNQKIEYIRNFHFELVILDGWVGLSWIGSADWVCQMDNYQGVFRVEFFGLGFPGNAEKLIHFNVALS